MNKIVLKETTFKIGVSGSARPRSRPRPRPCLCCESHACKGKWDGHWFKLMDLHVLLFLYTVIIVCFKYYLKFYVAVSILFLFLVSLPCITVILFLVG